MPTRRDFIALAAGTAAGMALVKHGSVLAQAAPDPKDSPAAGGFADSALVTGKPKPLKYEEIKGFLSKEQLTPHHTAHYAGAIKSLAQIEQELEGADRAKANANYAVLRELKREQTHAMNSAILHELYFDGISASPGKPGDATQALLTRRFGSTDKWMEDFKAAALCARGWAMLCHHPAGGKLYNVVADVHDLGPLVMGTPLIVIDCYEHAFYVDYRNKKGDYVNAWAQFLDWAEAERRVKALDSR